MTRLELTAEQLLTTTRAVRKRLDLDRPVDRSLIEECVELAMQAPTGSNRQTWRFVAVTDPDLRFEIAECYRRGFAGYRDSEKFHRMLQGGEGHAETQRRVGESAVHLADQMHRAPVLVIPVQHGVPGPTTFEQAGYWGSLYPAVWSFWLACRARGLGTVLTTIHLQEADRVAQLLRLPDDVTQGGLLPVAHFTGDTFKPAPRRPLETFLTWDGWSPLPEVDR